MQTKEEILEQLKEVLEELFEVEPGDVELGSHLYSDLDLDSIDAVDLVIKLKDITGKMASPEEFKSARTVGDVVDIIYGMLQK
ncbi:MAG: acyl carrier protein [Thioalkalispiraceae bacterium]|jgi:acyl carrier protein